MLTDPFFYAVAVPAVILLGLAKGGFAGIGVIAVPLMALAISPVLAASITLPILIVQDVVSVWAFRKTWDGKVLALMLPSAAAGIWLGYALAAFVKPGAVELAVGAVAVVPISAATANAAAGMPSPTAAVTNRRRWLTCS